MGNALATDTIPLLVTLVDVHNAKSHDVFYFANVSTGGAATKVIGRSQTLSAEVSLASMLTITVYECPEPTFTPEHARSLGILRVPVELLAERYSSGLFQQWFNLDTKSDPRNTTDAAMTRESFEMAYREAVQDVYQPKVCLSVIGSAFEVQRSGRQTCAIFVGEDVKTQAGPDLKALIASHKQQAAYIDALHEQLRKLNTPSYRPALAAQTPVVQQVQAPVMVQQPMMQMQPDVVPMMHSAPPQQFGGNFGAPGAVASNVAPMGYQSAPPIGIPTQ